MKTISLLNMKGGVGKTTTSVNLSVGLSMQGYKVLLVDFDPQSNSTYIFAEDPEYTINDLLLGNTSVENSILKANENLWIIPSELALANTEIQIRMQANAPQHNRLQKILNQVKDKFDFCIIDCGPIINLLTINAIIASDLIIIPIKPDVYALQGFNHTTSNINAIRDNYELDVDFKVLFTAVNRNNEERDMISQVRDIVSSRVFKTQIRSQPKPIAAASASRTAVIRELSESVGVAQDYRDLIDEILEG